MLATIDRTKENKSRCRMTESVRRSPFRVRVGFSFGSCCDMR